MRSQPTLAATLERDRLRHRAERLQRALDRLHERVTDHRVHGQPVPKPLRQAIVSFEDQLTQDRRALTSDLLSAPSATRVAIAPAIAARRSALHDA
jgi:hypothetical protein